jgi:hypothetical protein
MRSAPAARLATSPARNHIGLGVSFGPFDAMGRVTGYFREQCARHGWQPEPDQIIYRANILIAETGEKAQQALAQYPRQAVFPLKAEVGAALLELDQRNFAGEGRRPANVNRALPINFCARDAIPTPLPAPHTRAVQSVDAVTTRVPSGENAALRTEFHRRRS